jgi:hypothetical protein
MFAAWVRESLAEHPYDWFARSVNVAVTRNKLTIGNTVSLAV